MKTISGKAILLTITLTFALTSCTGELSERIESLTLVTDSLQQELEELEAESAARVESLTLATDSLQQEVEELKAESRAKSETLETLRIQIEHSTETSVRRYELSDVEDIGFKAEEDQTLIHQLSASFLSASFLFEDMSDGLVEFWKGSFHLAGEPPSVGIYFYDRNIEGKFGVMKDLNSRLGNPHVAVGNILVECDSKKVCEFIVDTLKSNSSSDRGITTATLTPQTAPSVSTTDSVIELTVAQLSQAYKKK